VHGNGWGGTPCRRADLRTRYGRDNTFIDVDSIGTGHNYRIGVGEAIQNSAVGRRLDDPDDNVRQEVEFALHLGRALPVRIDGA
jgi:hypothetical protein